MRCSLFGKLAAKRDFIAVAASRNFLNAWEPWMQGCVSASRDRLGDTWLKAYLTAPIWRFWLGADVCGATVIGALMCSLDGLGRYYPLTLFVQADSDAAIPPPDIDSQEDWFRTVEDFLLATLDQATSFETISNALEKLAQPARQALNSAHKISVVSDGIIGTRLHNGTFVDLLNDLRVANSANIYAAGSFWWTVGGNDYQPVGFCCRRMPNPLLFARMLTGELAASP